VKVSFSPAVQGDLLAIAVHRAGQPGADTDIRRRTPELTILDPQHFTR